MGSSTKKFRSIVTHSSDHLRFGMPDDSIFFRGERGPNGIWSTIVLLLLIVAAVTVTALLTVVIFDTLPSFLGEFRKITAVAIVTIIAGAGYYVYSEYRRRRIDKMIGAVRKKESHFYRISPP
jgi:uncharacterized membrane protein YbhN (UPF0104 family)